MIGMISRLGQTSQQGPRSYDSFQREDQPKLVRCRETRELILAHKRAADSVLKHLKGEFPPPQPVRNLAGEGRTGKFLAHDCNNPLLGTAHDMLLFSSRGCHCFAWPFITLSVKKSRSS